MKIYLKGDGAMFNSPFSPGMMPTYPSPYQMPQQQTTQVTRVNGENGARAYQMGPNSSALLLDESGTLIWLVTTDGAGYKTVSPYDIAPHQAAQPVDYSDLEMRIKKLEEIIHGNSVDPATAKQPGTGKD